MIHKILCSRCYCILLIVPEGIEIWPVRFLRAGFCVLLIVPEGIEIN